MSLPTYPRCATCKHWGMMGHDFPNDWGDQHGSCGVVGDYITRGPIYATGAYEDGAYVRTEATFGCVLHEPEVAHEIGRAHV